MSCRNYINIVSRHNTAGKHASCNYLGLPEIDALHHPDDGKPQAIGQGHLQPLPLFIAVGSVEWLAREGRRQFQSRETEPGCFLLAGPQNQAANAASRPLGMHEESSNA